MNLQEAIIEMASGKKVRLPEWMGYWFIPDGNVSSDPINDIKVFTRTGDILSSPWIDKYQGRDDFEVTEGRLGFDFAILALKNGKMVARKGWNGANMFAFMRPADELEIQFVSEGIKSLPQSVKDWFKKAYNGETKFSSGDAIKVKFGSYLCLKTVDNNIANGWQPSQTDLLAEDWCVVE